MCVIVCVSLCIGVFGFVFTRLGACVSTQKHACTIVFACVSLCGLVCVFVVLLCLNLFVFGCLYVCMWSVCLSMCVSTRQAGVRMSV